MKATPDWTNVQERVIQQIRDKWKQNQFSVEDIETVEGILFVNGLEQPVGGRSSDYADNFIPDNFLLLQTSCHSPTAGGGPSTRSPPSAATTASTTPSGGAEECQRAAVSSSKPWPNETSEVRSSSLKDLKSHALFKELSLADKSGLLCSFQCLTLLYNFTL